jgi:hypothetical protein
MAAWRVALGESVTAAVGSLDGVARRASECAPIVVSSGVELVAHVEHQPVDIIRGGNAYAG